MQIDPKVLAEIIVVFGPGVLVAILLGGLLIKIAKDLIKPNRS